MERSTLRNNRAGLGWLGVLLAGTVWFASVLALFFAMHHLSQPPTPLWAHPLHRQAGNYDFALAFWCTAFTLLQITSFLLFTFVFRAFWRLRSAVCFTLAVGLVIAGDAAGLLALLVWLGITLGAA